jgi:hypothetical protein
VNKASINDIPETVALGNNRRNPPRMIMLKKLMMNNWAGFRTVRFISSCTAENSRMKVKKIAVTVHDLALRNETGEDSGMKCR